MTDLARWSKITLAALAVVGSLAVAQSRAQIPTLPDPKPEMMENCPGLIATDTPRVVPAALRLALNPDQVRARFQVVEAQRRAARLLAVDQDLSAR